MNKDNQTIMINLDLLKKKKMKTLEDLEIIMKRVNYKREKVLSFESSNKKQDMNPHLKFLSSNPLQALDNLGKEMD